MTNAELVQELRLAVKNGWTIGYKVSVDKCLTLIEDAADAIERLSASSVPEGKDDR